MKKGVSLCALSWLTLGFGIIGIGLRIWLYATGLDQNALLIPGHPAETLIIVLSIVLLSVLLLTCRRLPASDPKHRTVFSGSWLSLAGCLAGGFATLISGIGALYHFRDFLEILSGILGILSFPALVWAGWNRKSGKSSSFLLHVTVCAFFAFHLISQYRLWCADPQLQDYCFPLLAGVSIMLVCYQHAVFDIGAGRPRALVFWSLAAVYFCCVSVPNCQAAPFYVACGFWIWTNLYHLSTPRASREAS